MNDLSRRLREAAAGCLPDRAFLRRDRAEALFITNAPRFAPETDWQSAFAEAGFISREEGGLIRLLPSEGWLSDLERAYPEPPDFLCGSLTKFQGLSIDPESIALFALGMRILDGDHSIPDYEKRLRQRAAVCLRSGGGGGLYACGIVNHIIKEENP